MSQAVVSADFCFLLPANVKGGPEFVSAFACLSVNKANKKKLEYHIINKLTPTTE